ncbi:glutamate-cysteine ligase [Weissella oryzae SG25]|uniref:Glutamate--cysteine ligase n=1 Tax=Weissella oryzae (strain DSM 25784 / JCM 18191 / LMG 30913 / SG25) TaxID=1329250 RepID=A0A069CXZ4_WEIOS|nr:hypothetical protein [Weissella oryzae]GAK29951.1 glutamate-cysteine ligase [Weissella oryzae SG25]
MQKVEFQEKLALYSEQSQWSAWLMQGNFGLELEVNRAKNTGHLSHAPYPKSFGNRQIHPFLKSDYSEGMIELTTQPQPSMQAAHNELTYLVNLTRNELADDEILWPFSLPPKVNEADIFWLDTTFKRFWVKDYRDYLKQRYGSVHAIISGPHVNFSLSANLLAAMFEVSKQENQITFNNQIYFKLAKGIENYRWLFIYLFGSSPLNLNQADQIIPQNLSAVRSLRNSVYGYVNKAENVINIDGDFAQYVSQIEAAIEAGKLFSNHEYYGTVRFKGAENYQTLLEHGIKYLELRVVDTNPFDEYGLSVDDLAAIQLIILWIFIKDQEYSVNDIKRSRQKADEIALLNPSEEVVSKELVNQMIDELTAVNHLVGGQLSKGLKLIATRLSDVNATPAAQLMKLAPEANDLQELIRKFGVARQKAYRQLLLPEVIRVEMQKRLRGEVR